MPHDLTHSPEALWQLDGDLLDSSGNGHHLGVAHGSERYLEIGGIGSGILGHFFEVGGGVNGIGTELLNSDAALRIAGDVTLELLFQPAGITVGRGSVLSILVSCAGDPESTDVEVENFQYDLRLDNNSNRMATFNEEGVGVNNYYQSTFDLPDNTIQHLAMVRDVSGGNDNVIHRLFRNGTKVFEHTTGRVPTGGSQAEFRLGFYHAASAAADASVRGIMSSVKVIASALTDPQVAAEAALALDGLAGSPTAPTITGIAPSPAELGPTDQLSFTVNNATTRTIVAIQYPGLAVTEVVHDGDAFTAAYSPTSTLTDLGGGAIQYTVRRSPIWPDAPTVKVYAFSGGAEL